MGGISYDPVKDRFADLIRNSSWLRRGFYALLDLFFLRSWHLRRLLRDLGKGLDHSGPWDLLDAGSGFGQYDRFLLKQFRNVSITAIDLKEEYLADCKRHFRREVEEGRIRFEQRDLLELDERERYDLILCVDVLEHIEEDRLALRNMARALKRGGYLLMHSPSHYSEQDARGEGDSFVEEHARPGYSKEEIREKMRDAGLEPVRSHYTYGTWGHLSWKLTIQYPMLLLNRVGMAGLVVLLFYYPPVLPFALLMNLTDLFTANESGGGIWALARKQE